MTRAGLKDEQAKATAMESRKTAERISLSMGGGLCGSVVRSRRMGC